ncbi:hypothetical protein COCOBI_18-2310 [Coccomyxa sp. Obi]|nr:hypothetical protein COCOBI_18-2310 [Coccomyxa sp. Obi]
MMSQLQEWCWLLLNWHRILILWWKQKALQRQREDLKRQRAALDERKAAFKRKKEEWDEQQRAKITAVMENIIAMEEAEKAMSTRLQEKQGELAALDDKIREYQDRLCTLVAGLEVALQTYNSKVQVPGNEVAAGEELYATVLELLVPVQELLQAAQVPTQQ